MTSKWDRKENRPGRVPEGGTLSYTVCCRFRAAGKSGWLKKEEYGVVEVALCLGGLAVLLGDAVSIPRSHPLVTRNNL